MGIKSASSEMYKNSPSPAAGIGARAVGDNIIIRHLNGRLSYVVVFCYYICNDNYN